MNDRHDLNAGDVPAPWSGGAGDVRQPPGSAAVQHASDGPPAALQHWQLAEDTLDHGAQLQWGRLGRAFRRYWWVLVATLGLGIGGSAVMWKVMSPVYLAEGALWMERDDVARANQGPIASGNLLQAQAWLDLLTSFAVLDSVVLKERLHIRPRDDAAVAALSSLTLDSTYSPGTYVLNVGGDGSYELTDVRGYSLETGRLGGPIGASYGINWSPSRSDLSADQIAFTLVTLRDASAALSQELETRMDERGSFIRIRLTGRDPVKITSILNTLMDRHVSLAAQLKRARLDERVEIVAEQLGDVERDLASAEGSLEEFRTRTITLPSDRATPIAPGLQMTRDPVFSNFNAMRVELEDIRTDRDRIRRALAEIPNSGVSIETLEMITAVAASTQLSGALTTLSERRAELRTALYRYTPDHPSVVGLQDHVDKLERETIPILANELIASLERREADMQNRIADASAELSAIPGRTIREGQLSRAVEMSSTIYGDLSRRFEIATLEARSSLPDVRLLDAATVPDVPDHDLRPRLAAMALLLSIGLGVGIVVVLDQTDRRVRDPQQVTSDFGLSILGMVPRLHSGAPKNGDAAPIVEAFREIRLNTAYAYGSAGPMIFNISSPAPQEGKSFVAANLAIAFAGFGRRTLLIDGDTRRGNLHRLFALERKPGLVDYLEGEAPSDDIIKSTDFDGLDVVSSGQRSETSPELLGSKAMTELITAARTKYDVIIVDSPPLSAGTDAFLLSTLTRHLALVIRSGTTDKTLLQAKLAPLQRLPVRVLGAVLNDTSGSAYRYYSNYLPGYEAHSENGSSKRLSDRSAAPAQVVVVGE